MTDLKLKNGRLWVAGAFSDIANNHQRALATLNPATGRILNFFRGLIAGVHNGGVPTVIKMDITPSGDRLLAVGNFDTLDGVKRHQMFVLDTSGATAVPAAIFNTTFYQQACSSSFQSYMRDVDISPDGSYAVVSTTGAYGGAGAPCDSVSRWEIQATGTDVRPSWVSNTGGDTTYAVEVTDSVVYTGGHARWQNNPFRADVAGQGAVSRPGIAALDPINGLPRRGTRRAPAAWVSSTSCTPLTDSGSDPTLTASVTSTSAARSPVLHQDGTIIPGDQVGQAAQRRLHGLPTCRATRAGGELPGQRRRPGDRGDTDRLAVRRDRQRVPQRWPDAEHLRRSGFGGRQCAGRHSVVDVLHRADRQRDDARHQLEHPHHSWPEPRRTAVLREPLERDGERRSAALPHRSRGHSRAGELRRRRSCGQQQGHDAELQGHHQRHQPGPRSPALRQLELPDDQRG